MDLQRIVDILSLCALALYVSSLSVAIVSVLTGKEGFRRLYFLLLPLGIVTHLAALVVRSLFVGHAPMANLYETLLFFSFCVSIATFTYHIVYRVRLIELFTLTVASGLLIFAIMADHGYTPLYIALKTIWFEIHVMASFAGYALFTASFSSALFFLIFQRKKQPETRIYEEMTNSANLWGFSLFSIAMFSGAVWAYLAWGNYWFWEPKTIWSFILWFYFAGIVHGHYVKRWRGRRVAIMTAVGFAVVIFTYVGVGLLMKSTHNL